MTNNSTEIHGMGGFGAVLFMDFQKTECRADTSDAMSFR